MKKRFHIKYLIVVFLAVVGVVAVYLDGSPFVFGDGYGYFHTAKQLATENRFVSSDEPPYYPYSRHGVVKVDGRYVTRYSPGSALLWYPALKIASYFDDGTTAENFYKAYNGHSIADGIAILITAVAVTIIGITALYAALRILKFGQYVSIFSVGAVFLSSHILHYVLETPATSHAYDLGLMSVIVFLIVFVTNKRVSKKQRNMLYGGIGVLSGLSFLVRPTNVIMLVPLYFYLYLRSRTKPVTFTKRGLYILAGAIPFILVFFLFNYVSFGGIFKNGYIVLAGTYANFSLGNFNLFGLLFSGVRGWYVYSPIMLAGTVGLVIYSWRSRERFVLSLLPVLMVISVYTFWGNWWGGSSIGQRFFIVLSPFISIGVANICSIASKRRRVVQMAVYLGLVLMVLYSFLITVMYRVTPTHELRTMYEKEQDWYGFIARDKRWTPIDLYRYHLDELSRVGDVAGYTQSVIDTFHGRYTLEMLHRGRTQPILNVVSEDDREVNLYFIPKTRPEKGRFGVDITVLDDEGLIYRDHYSNISTEELQGIQISCEETMCTSDWEKVGVRKFKKHDRILSRKMGELTVKIYTDKEFFLPNYRIKASD